MSDENRKENIDMLWAIALLFGGIVAAIVFAAVISGVGS